MRTDQPKKGTAKTDSRINQENIQSTRCALKPLQPTCNTQSLAGRVINTKDKPTEKILQMHKSTQTEEYSSEIDDITSEEPSREYWKRVAEKRQEFIDECLEENDKLNDSIQLLKEENKICKEMLDETKCLVEVLKEMLNESDSEETATNETTE